jgi:hypothetical protein
LRAPNLDVQPSPEIEARVAVEVAQANLVLATLNTQNVVASPYLVSAIYYHEGFLDDFPVDRTSAGPERRIIGQISRLVTREKKEQFVRVLHQRWMESRGETPERSVLPVVYKVASGRRNHRYAIDLFAPEGAPVFTVSRGIAVLAERDWTADDPFSTTSRKGGNTVIVFDPDHDRFYRYCHLSTTQVSAGSAIAAGEVIGTVGHTGLNASQPGHGRHLHFESNEYRDGRVQAMDYARLRTLLHQFRSSSGAVEGGEQSVRVRRTTGRRAALKR